MDAKITKKRLNDQFSYDWIKVVAITLIVTLLWWILYSVTGERLTKGENFTFLFATDRYGGDSVKGFMTSLEKSGRFSYGIREINYELVDPNDGYDAAETVAKFTEAEFDVGIFTDYLPNGYEKDAEGNYRFSVFRTYTDMNAVMSFDEAIRLAHEFLEPFYEGGNIGADRVMIASAVEKYFLSKKLDNRFRTEEEKKRGIVWEKERFEKYCEETVKLETLLAEHPELFVYYNRFEQENARGVATDPAFVPEKGRETETVKRPYGIDLATFNAAEIVRGPDGETSKNCALCLFNYYKRVGDLFFEGFAAVNYFVETYRAGEL